MQVISKCVCKLHSINNFTSSHILAWNSLSATGKLLITCHFRGLVILLLFMRVRGPGTLKSKHDFGASRSLAILTFGLVDCIFHLLIRILFRISLKFPIRGFARVVGMEFVVVVWMHCYNTCVI